MVSEDGKGNQPRKIVPHKEQIESIQYGRQIPGGTLRG